MGGEFMSKEFEAYLASQSIWHQTSVAYTPEQNGVAERYNHSIIESTRASLHDTSHLPSHFWEQAVQNAVYMKNRLPTQATMVALHTRCGMARNRT